MTSLDVLVPFCRRLLPASIVLLAAGAVLPGLDAMVSAADAETVTTATLLDEMTNLAEMAEFPSPAYTCKQFFHLIHHYHLISFVT